MRRGQASPLLWAKNKQMGPEMAEPTSPKVTCAGQIKVRPKAAAAAGAACKSWQSVMEEIERIHNSRNKVQKKRPGWMESLGLKKEIMQFLTCLRSIRFDLRCFGSFPESEATSDGEAGEDNYEYPLGADGIDGKETSRTIFSKWFMVLQENQSNVLREERREKERSLVDAPPIAPPPNALLLMRCRSAPAKSWLREKEEEDHDEGEEKEEKEEEEKGRRERMKKLSILIEEEKREQEEQRERTEKMGVTRYGTDLRKGLSDVTRDRWVRGGARDMLLSRSISWKR